MAYSGIGMFPFKVQLFQGCQATIALCTFYELKVCAVIMLLWSLMPSWGLLQ